MDFVSFIIGAFTTTLLFLFTWNMKQKRDLEKIDQLKKEILNLEKKQKESLQLAQEKSLLQIQKEQMSASLTLQKSKSEHDQFVKQETEKLSLEKQRLHQANKSLIRQEEELNRLKATLISLIETHHNRPLPELIESVAKSDLHVQRVKASQELKQLEIDSKFKMEQILISSLERATLPTTRELNTSTLLISNESIIPQLIGKEGRTIRRFEELLGVTARFDEPTSSLIITSFNGKRRMLALNVARELISSGKISLKLLEEMTSSIEAKFSSQTISRGKEVAEQFCLILPTPLLKQIGEMEFYSSWGQNLLLHSIEVASIAESLSLELGFRVEKAATMGLLHDIGKTLPPDSKPHALSGAQFAAKHGISSDIVNGIAAHHKEMMPTSSEARLIPIADSISASLPGARLISLEELSKRTKDIEEFTLQLPNVIQAYSQSGGKLLHVVLNAQVDEEHIRKQLLEIIPSIEHVSFSCT